jgi:hypothetical protein
MSCALTGCWKAKRTKKKEEYPMNKIIIILFIMLSLSACRLAREGDVWPVPQEDMFIGFYVTLWDWNTPDPFGPFHDRIYAERAGDFQFIFPNLAGIPFYIGTVTNETPSGTSTVTFSDVDLGIISHGMHVHISDNEVRHRLSGTLNVNPRLAENIYQFNPVFQTPEGDIYIARGGSSISASRDSWEEAAEGPLQSFRQEETVTITENGVSTTRSISVELGIAILFPPERFVVLQMDAEHRVLYRDEFAPQHVPDIFHPLPGTAYMIVETHRNPATRNPIIRVLSEPGDPSFETFYVRDNGVVNRRFTQVEWAS